MRPKAAPFPQTAVYLVLAGLVMAMATGCLVATPIAVFPAPELGSGMKITFCDGFGERISEDGLLIVHREYRIPVGWRVHHCGVSNKVVDIVDGKATIPHQWVVASVWLMPNPFSYFIIPMPIVLPGYNLEIIPLIPGYNYHSTFLETRVLSKHGEIFPAEIGYHAFKDGMVSLSSSAGEPDRGIMYLELYTLPRLRRPHEKRGADEGPDLCLADKDYTRVRHFIDKELKNLRVRQAQPSQPATLPQ